MKPERHPVFDLPADEKLQLIHDLWEDLPRSPESVPIHKWQIDALEQRKANLERAPESATNWEDAERRIRSHHRRP